MRKSFRPVEFVLAVAALVTALTACSLVKEATTREPNPHLNYYPETGIITDCIKETDTVVVQNCCGILWEFYGIEDFQVGDMVSMIMDDMDTPGMILDDSIVGVHYAGIPSWYTVPEVE